MELSIGSIVAVFKTFATLLGQLRPSRATLHRKCIEENRTFFWIVHNPKYPGQPLWAEVSIANGRDRICVFWPGNQLGLPWGLDGNGDKACYCPLISPSYAQSAIAQGRDDYRLSENQKMDELARSNWGNTEHMRAGFVIEHSKLRKRLGDWVRIKILDQNRNVQASLFKRLRSI